MTDHQDGLKKAAEAVRNVLRRTQGEANPELIAKTAVGAYLDFIGVEVDESNIQ